MADPNDSGFRLADILPYLAAAGAGVATAYGPRRIGPAVQAGLGTFMGLQNQMRLSQVLKDEKQKKEQFTQNFGRLVDYYQPHGVPSIRPEDAPAGTPPGTDLAGQWLKDQGYPEHALIDERSGEALKALAPINAPVALSRLDAALTKERRPTLAEASAVQLPPDMTIKGTTAEGLGFERKGSEPALDIRPRDVGGQRFYDTINKHTGKLIGQPTLGGPIDQQPTFATHGFVTADGQAALGLVDQRTKKSFTATFGKVKTPDELKDRFANYRDKLVTRTRGLRTGDSYVDSLDPSVAGQIATDLKPESLSQAIADIFQSGVAGKPAAAPTAPPPAPKPAPRPDPLGIR